MPIQLLLFAFFLSLFTSKNDFNRSDHNSSNLEISDDTRNRVASKVLNDLKRAKGILPYEKPFVKVENYPGGTKLGFKDPVTGNIVLHTSTYNMCRNMGADSLNCLAFILGHELGHAIHKHRQVHKSIEEYQGTEERDKEILSEIDSLVTNDSTAQTLYTLVRATMVEHAQVADEAESDMEGGFLGFLAGYNVDGRKFFEAAHKARKIKLQEVASGYPDLDERIKIVEDTYEDLEEMKFQFNMANYLAAIEQYEDALWYYERITEKFQSREIYNNMGALALMETMRLFEKDSLTKFRFPITLDVDSRIDKDKSGAASIEVEKALELTTKAIANFSKALNYDADYPVAHLNLSIAYAIRGILYKDKMDQPAIGKKNLVTAESHCYQGQNTISQINDLLGINTDNLSQATISELNKSNINTLANLHTQLGIIHSLRNETETAIRYFDIAMNINANHQLACHNKNLIDNCEIERVSNTGVGIGDFCVLRVDDSGNEVVSMDNEKMDVYQVFEFFENSGKWNSKAKGVKELIPSIGVKFDTLFQHISYGKSGDIEFYYNKTQVDKENIEESYFVVPGPSFSGQSHCGISRWTGEEGGSSALTSSQDVLNKYGDPYKTVQTTNGSLMVYRPTNGKELSDEGDEDMYGIIFQISPEGHVQNWVPFYKFLGSASF